MANFDRIAHFCLAETAQAMPPAAIEMAAWLMLDTLGVAFAATPMEAGQIAGKTAKSLYGATGGAAAARIIGDGARVSPAGAAFAAAMATDNLDAHDGYNPCKGHIGVAVIPAVAALADELAELGQGPLSGPDTLAAVVVGYEIAGRAGLSLHASVSDYHTSGAWNALGVAAMGARLHGMDRDGLRHALGIAEYHGPRSQMMREIANPTMLHDGSSMGALVGLSAVSMARLGMTGAPAITIEAEEVAQFWADLGTHWIVQHQYIKPYPICRWAHGSIDAVAKIMGENGLSARDIASVEIRTFDQGVALFDGMPETTSQAQYSLKFAVANMIQHGEIGVAQISGAGLGDESVAALLPRISVAATDKHNARFPAGRWADASIETRDGRRLDSGDVNASGSAEEPWSHAQILDKFNRLAEPVLGEARAHALAEAIIGLPSGSSTWDDVARHLYQPLG